MCKKCNNCGVGLIPKRLRFIIPYRCLFDPFCKIHDTNYIKNNNKTRGEIDKEFLNKMLYVSSNIFKVFFAYLYYYLVRIFGKKYFIK